MKILIVLLTLVALLLVGCSHVTQKSASTLYEKYVSPEVTEIPNKNYVGMVSIGPEGKRVPIGITWSVGQDSTECLKVANLKVVDMDSDHSGLVIRDVKHTVFPKCMMKFESTDNTRFQSVDILLNYEAKIGIKSYSFNGRIATIQGNGDFISNSKQ